MNLRWFISKSVRHAAAMRKHVRHLLSAQRDILSLEAFRKVEEALSRLGEAINTGADKPRLNSEMTELETAANRWLKPYPHHAWRENVEVFLVALAVAMGIRTFFLQPFKIPTGGAMDSIMPPPGVRTLT